MNRIDRGSGRSVVGGALAAAAAAALGLAVLAILVAAREPSLERTWDDDVAVLAGVELQPDGAVRLSDVRDWQYTRDSVVSQRYFDARYDPADIVGLWLYEQELGLGGRVAHTFLVFEFGPGAIPEPERWLGLSVETRREAGEKYSIVRGMLREFEVTHIWATERDLVTRRVEYLDYPLTRYRVDVPDEYLGRIFLKFLRETDALATTPRWYNTLTTNCTSSLIEYVNQVEPGAIPRHFSSVLTGRADDHLRRLGYLDPDYALPITRDWLAANTIR
ncbi:MAG TPA: DUF4105 domain-containing protein [Gemmatimonadota bacterium]|nr:DUF4105 domain-containing protein [Gemmatimonadota bacterium]